MTTSCWLIGDLSGQFPIIAMQFARLRGLEVQFVVPGDGSLPLMPSDRKTMAAMDFEVFEQLQRRQKDSLKALVQAGMTLYVRGGFKSGSECSLQPFADVGFVVASDSKADGYRFTRHRLLPKALENEEVEDELELRFARGLDVQASEVILYGRDREGIDHPAIFTVRQGVGTAIFDLQPEPNPAHYSKPIAHRMGDPVARCVDIGALIAVDAARGRALKRAGLFNLTIDDRPANFDYFNVGNLRRFLEHLEQRHPNAHLDFAWTPSCGYPSRRYVETMKEFNSGFVWHGLRRHVHHQQIADPAAELLLGKRLVEKICKRYDISFQRVMVFPFEHDSLESIEALRRENFLALSAMPQTNADFEEERSVYLRYSTPAQTHRNHGIRILYRQPADSLTWNEMLAMAVLDLPIIAYGHPRDVALRRLAFVRKIGRSYSYFDSVLRFAFAKKLSSASLAEIAAKQSDVGDCQL
jgi:hypothetical protein